MSTRRKFLKILGGGTIFAATASVAFVTTRTPHAALAPWQPAPYADPRMAALSHAVLAPSPHNRQPWLIELQGEDTVLIHRDENRDLPMTDPFHRQLFIGLGAFLETMVLAAGAGGHSVDLTLLPEGDDGPVARAVFLPGAEADPLATQILDRHSNKQPYTDRRLTSDEATILTDYADLILDDDRVAAIREMTERAFRIEMETPRTLRESVELMRIGKAEINANPDGIELTGPALEVLRRIGLLDEDVLMNLDHPGNKAQLAAYYAMLRATHHYAVVTTPGNTRLDQIAAGRRTVRLYLKTTEMGLGLHPVSQALQEYVEMADEYALAHRMLAPEDHTVQMLLRLGHGPAPVATPRWPLESRIVNDI